MGSKEASIMKSFNTKSDVLIVSDACASLIVDIPCPL